MLTLEFVEFSDFGLRALEDARFCGHLAATFCSVAFLFTILSCLFAAMNLDEAKSFLVDVFPCLGEEATRMSNQAKIM